MSKAELVSNILDLAKVKILVDGKEVVHSQILDENTIHLSTTKPIGQCNNCGTLVYKLTDYKGGEYVARCPYCGCNKTESQICKYS